MPTHAEQHFVPKFYLRNFSADKRSLHLVNIATTKVIHGASLRKQCARTKFYDFDKTTEYDLARLEDRAAPIIRQLIRGDRFLQPELEYKKYVTLILFVVVQHLRGLRVAAAHDLLTDYYAKLMLQGRTDGVDLSRVRISNKYPAAIPLQAVPDLMPSAMQLRPHLLINRSSLDFITSDDPVVLHNQYCEGIHYQGVLGWDSRGVQAFVALSPRHMLVLFDARVYRMGSRRSHLATEITNAAEVEQFNAMQIMHAVANVYFAKIEDAERTRKLVTTHVKDRPKRSMTIVETSIVGQPDGTGKSLLHTFRPLLRQKLKVSAIRWRDGVSRIDLHDRGRLIGRSGSYWAKHKSGERYEISRFIGAYDDIAEPIVPSVPPYP